MKRLKHTNGAAISLSREDWSIIEKYANKDEFSFITHNHHCIVDKGTADYLEELLSKIKERSRHMKVDYDDVFDLWEVTYSKEEIALLKATKREDILEKTLVDNKELAEIKNVIESLRAKERESSLINRAIANTDKITI